MENREDLIENEEALQSTENLQENSIVDEQPEVTENTNNAEVAEAAEATEIVESAETADGNSGGAFFRRRGGARVHAGWQTIPDSLRRDSSAACTARALAAPHPRGQGHGAEHDRVLCVLECAGAGGRQLGFFRSQ